MKHLLKRIGRSLIRDFLLPWLVSFVCIVGFFAMVVKFGVIWWPICFGFFLYVCHVRGEGRRTATAHEKDD
jgi:hypothetical protein